MNMKSIQTYILPVVCVGISILLVVVVINPSLAKLKLVQQQLVELRQSEQRVEELLAIYDSLRAKYQEVSTEQIAVLEKALPSNVNNVRLILELERIAELQGLGFKDVDVVLKKDSSQSETATPDQLRKVVATMTLVGDYPSFIQYLSDLEQSLRIVTTRSIDFKAVRSEKAAEQFEFKVVIETYWFVYPENTVLSSTATQ